MDTLDGLLNYTTTDDGVTIAQVPEVALISANTTVALTNLIAHTHSSARDGVYRLSLQLGIEVDPDTALWVAAGAVAVLAVLVCLLWRIVVEARRRARMRNNALVVRMADEAPEDDEEEHELEKHSDARAAAPGDSDFEDDFGPRKNGTTR